MDETAVAKSWLGSAIGSLAVAAYGIGALTWVLVEDGLRAIEAWQLLIVIAAAALFTAMGGLGALVIVRRSDRYAATRVYTALSLMNAGAGLVAGASLYWIGGEIGWDPLRWISVQRWWLIAALLLPLPLGAATVLSHVVGRGGEGKSEELRG